MRYEADYVVVGAGAAGSVVAARLAQDGTRSVIVVEAGPDNTADPTIAAAARYPFLLDMPATVGPHPSPSHWGFISKQNGKDYCYPRGTGLGGSTNHHAAVDGRGSPLIYDEWARQTGDERWSYERLLPVFKKMENFDVPYVDETVHGKTGWLHIKRAKLERGFHPDLLHVAMQEHGMPFRHDFYNDPKNFAGIGWCDMQVHNDGRRSNAAVDLLLPTLEKTRSIGWNNLQILTDKLAARVLIDRNRAVGVEVLGAPRAYKADAAHRSNLQTASRVMITAKKEVILCGGAINSPQLLMLSGIGPKDHLNQHGIAVVKDLPGVGQHLQDHVEVCHVFRMKNLPDKLWRWQSTFLAEAGAQYAANADPSSFTENYIPLVMDWFSGFDARNPMHPDLHIHVFTAFFRDFNLNPQRWVDADPLKASYLDQFLSQVDATEPLTFNTFLIECVKPSPTRGQITLWSADPTEPPVVDLCLHEAEADLTRLAMGMELLRNVMAHAILRQYETQEVLPGPSYATRNQLEDYVRKYSAFGHHISGTARMGRESDRMAVVDSECRVIGLDGLRVCDASVFPEIPAYNTSRPSYLVGEVLGELLTAGSDQGRVRAERETKLPR
ncbi:MAG: GMC family oxidoreductase N-terminal domain-containing protein [Acidobacteria bacterium]|nr:GMC family oxidoreductase N-terminal domain-containing protein [Acidobacteriota bacterium]